MSVKPYPYQFPHVSDAHLRAIGHLVLQWTKVDNTINTAIGYAGWRLKIKVLPVESTSPFGNRITTWRDFGLQLFPKEKKKIESLQGTAANLHDKRNAIFHGYLAAPWPNPADPEALVSVRKFIAKPGFPKLTGLTSSKIQEMVHKVGWLDRDFQQFHGEIGWFWSSGA